MRISISVFHREKHGGFVFFLPSWFGFGIIINLLRFRGVIFRFTWSVGRFLGTVWDIGMMITLLVLRITGNLIRVMKERPIIAVVFIFCRSMWFLISIRGLIFLTMSWLWITVLLYQLLFIVFPIIFGILLMSFLRTKVINSLRNMCLLILFMVAVSSTVSIVKLLFRLLTVFTYFTYFIKKD